MKDSTKLLLCLLRVPVAWPNKPVWLPSWMKSSGHNATSIIPTSISVNIGHRANAAVPMLERLDGAGILTICSDSQRAKASCPIEITDPGISKVPRAEHPAKADDSMLVIPPGNRIDCRAVQAENAWAPIDTTLSGSQIEEREQQSKNALRSTVLNWQGICILASDRQLKKARLPIDVTVSGIWISFSSVQHMNALARMAVTDSSTRTRVIWRRRMDIL
jgi:hypothetical protein